MTYDSGRGKVVLFGKDFAGCAGNDIWDWDGNAATWTERNPPDGVRAGWRGSPGLVYDSARRRVVVYGGMPYMAEHPDSTWEWNGEDGSWTLRSEDGDGPAGGLQWNALWDLDLAYDPVRGRVLLFGGAFYAECPWGYDGCEDWDDVSANRLWEWDGEAATWMRVPFGDPWPDSRRRLSVDYDTARGRLVVFGGVRSDFDSERERRVFAVEEYGDLWEWDAGGQTWLERTPGATRPAEREGHSLVYDSVRERVLLFGGHSASGCGEGGGAYCGQTWEWNLEAGGWADRTPVGGGPGPRTDAAMAYDPATGWALLFGGFNADDCGEEHGRDGTGLQTTACAWTWEWDGAAGTWTRLEPVTSPSPRWGHGMVHDPVEGRFVLFGGQHRRVRGNRPYWLNDTWVWWPEGNTWRSSAHADPEERKDHAMAFDEGRGKVVLHGGSGRSYWWVGDRSPWELDWGSWRWSRRADQDPLGALCSDHTMVFDPQRGKMVFFGGCLEEDYLEWDGDTGEAARWTARGARPGPRSNHAMVFDPALGKVLVSGGRGAPGQGDLVTWSWQGAADDIPAVLWRIPFSIAHTQPVDLLRVSAQAHAGGVGHPDAVATPGAHLLAWDTVQGDWLGAQVAGWRVLASNEAVADAPAPLEWTTRDPEAMRRTVFGEEEALHLVVAPLAPNGTGADAGQVAVDYLEATVEYRLVREFGWRFDQRCLCRYWHPGACCPQGHTDDDLTCAGWQPENVTTVCEDPEPGLWCMVLDADEPRLVSPPIEEDPRRYRYVEVRARNWNWDTSYEVRFTWHFEGEEGFPDGRGVTFDVEPSWDLAARIYRVPLDVPGWLAGDRLVRLRLDLPTPPVGEVFTLDWIRLSGDEYEVDCQNGEDDDADDLVDCEDPECATDPECEGR